MKRAVLVWLMATVLVLAGSAAWSASITIFDPEQSTPVNPTVTATGFDPPYYSTPIIETAIEYAHVVGYVYTPWEWMVPSSPPTKWLESAGGPVSDFMFFDVSPWDSITGSQRFEVRFWSNGAADFVNELNSFNQAFPDPTTTYVEDGTPRGWNYSTFLQVYAVCGAPVPLPGSLLLLGSGLLSIVGLRSFRKG
jgi:hypothetical protein